MNLQKISKAGLLKFSIIIPIALAFVLSSYTQPLASSPTERGTISINPSMMMPVLVVDGKVMPKDFDTKIINKDSIQSYVILTPNNTNITEELIAKYGHNAKYGVIVVTSKKNESKPSIKTFQSIDSLCNKTFTIVEMLPLFPGGEQKMNEFIKNNLIFPETVKQNKIHGKVVVRFVVSSMGTIEHTEVVKSFDPECDKEAIRAVNSLPFFIPGRQNGVNVCVHFTLLVTFENPQPYNPEKMPVLVLDGKPLPKGFDTKSLNKDSIQSVFVLKPDTKEKREELIAKYGENAKNGVIVITSKKNNRPSSTQAPQNTDSFGKKIYTIVEMRPLFPGGDGQLNKFIENNLIYPASAKQNKIEGRVIVRFVVNSIGKVEQCEVLKSLDPDCDKEALRVVTSLPVFTPGKQEGVNVSVYYTLPIAFKL